MYSHRPTFIDNQGTISLSMRKILIRAISYILLIVPVQLYAQAPVEVSLLSRKQQTITVSDFNDYPPGQDRIGTLRQAVSSAKPGSIIVFANSGTIRLRRPLEISVSGLTIDGARHPVMIRGDVVRIMASDCTLRHLWIFAGDAAPDPKAPGKLGHTRGSDRDALVIWGPKIASGQEISNIRIEHCWIGFGVDECLSTYGAVRKISVRDSIIGFGLNRSIHPDDRKRRDVPGHGKGVLVGVGARDVHFARNLLVHNFDRNIQVRSGTSDVRFVNNVVYSWGRGNTFVAGDGDPKLTSSGMVIGNIYLAGKASFTDSRIFKPADPVTAAAYVVRGNIGPVLLDTSVAHARESLREDSPLIDTDRGAGFLSAWQSYDEVLTSAGPHPGLNDLLSQMVVDQVTSRSGNIIDYWLKPVNPQAKLGLGFMPTMRKIVPTKRLRGYLFDNSQRRVIADGK